MLFRNKQFANISHPSCHCSIWTGCLFFFCVQHVLLIGGDVSIALTNLIPWHTILSLNKKSRRAQLNLMWVCVCVSTNCDQRKREPYCRNSYWHISDKNRIFKEWVFYPSGTDWIVKSECSICSIPETTLFIKITCTDECIIIFNGLEKAS